MHDAHPDRNNRKLATVTNAKITIKSPLNPLADNTLEPSTGKKQKAKTIIVNAIRGANLKTIFFASLGSFVFQQELLRENLAAFELGGALVRTENAKAAGLKNVHDTGAQRRFGADNGEIDLLPGSKCGQRRHIGGGDRHALGQVGNAGIAGSAKEFCDPRALGEFPDERVFAPAASDDEDFHADFRRHCK